MICRCAALIVGMLLLTAAAPVRTDTPQGPVRGARDHGVESFKGIPYAAPPVGDLRWRAPRPAPHWDKTRDATTFGPVCIQKAPASIDTLADRPQSEDCLTLNIWRPVGAKQAPVMLWIHGGANLFGSGSESYYDGTAFAKRGVVLVTINYRLGHLGFFSHPALGKAGENRINYGLLDQIAALAWVKDNIAAYGGDPGKVTIFGESAGGAAVLNMLEAPAARGLFQRAIVESGGGLITKRNADTATRTGEKVAKALGVKGKDADAAAALRALPAKSFIGDDLPRTKPGFGAVPGGAQLSEPPLAAIRDGKAAKVPLMIGINSNEGSLSQSWGMTPDQVLKTLGGRAPKIARAYGAQTEDKAAYARHLYRDVIFAYPAREIARAQRAAGAPAWLYQFDYILDAVRDERDGVDHGGEIPFVFDMAADKAKIARSDKDERYAAGVNSCFAAFGVSGTPSDAEFCKNWHVYDPQTDNWFVFDDIPTEQDDLSSRQLDAIGDVLRLLGMH